MFILQSTVFTIQLLEWLSLVVPSCWRLDSLCLVRLVGIMMSSKQIILAHHLNKKPYYFLGRSLDVILHRTEWYLGAELYGTGMSERKGRQSWIGKKFANNIFLYYASSVHWGKLELPFSRRSRSCPHFSSADGYP